MSIISKLIGGNKKEKIKSFLENGAVVIDVRNPGEFEARRYEGSKNIPLNKIQDELENIKALNKPVVVCCASGVRSGHAKSLMEKQGIEVINAGGWRALRDLD